MATYKKSEGFWTKGVKIQQQEAKHKYACLTWDSNLQKPQAMQASVVTSQPTKHQIWPIIVNLSYKTVL